MPHLQPVRHLHRLSHSPRPLTHRHSPTRAVLTTCNPHSPPKASNDFLLTSTPQKLFRHHCPRYPRVRSLPISALHQQSSERAAEGHGASRRCRSCSTPTKDAFESSMTIAEKCKCAGCGALVPVAWVVKPEQPDGRPAGENEGRLDYFGLFGIEKKFAVDPGTLKKAYHRWQQVVHPDFIGSSKSYKDREDSKEGRAELEGMKQWSMLVNRAKDVLSDDLKRAEYLIGLDGRIQLSQEADSSTDSELLMEVMEIHQELEEARTPQEIEQIKASNRHSIKKLLKDLNQTFESLNKDSPDENRLETLKRFIIRLRYLKNIDQLEKT